ncbi:hypothetical protein ACFLV9_00085 [Chloroflexota bacterium]
MGEIVVTIADKRALFSVGVRRALSRQPDFEIFAGAPGENPIVLKVAVDFTE